MKPLYFITYLVLKYTLRIYYPKRKIYNKIKGNKGSTIYVCNHAASFMDPLVFASISGRIVYFMTRSDVFTKLTNPFLRGLQMLPIYRKQDGEDTREKNEKVFHYCSKILRKKKNLLIFGEGFTDDIFIRRLKPVKKGAIRIGFQTLENINWNQKISIAAAGINYSNPNKLGSELILSLSDKICLNDYQKEYEENPNKVINQITKNIEKLMQEQITHVENKELATLHENIMQISRKGLNAYSYDKNIPLEKRWDYSRKLAFWLNKENIEANLDLKEMKEKSDLYFNLLKKIKINDQFVFWKKENQNGSRFKEIKSMIFFFPFAILGIIHCGLPYIIVKRFVENSFRRKVFWASVKMILGAMTIGIINIPIIFFFYYFIFPNWILSFFYYLTIGITGLCAYLFIKNLKDFVLKGKIKKTNLSEAIKRRDELKKIIDLKVPIS
ncbi:MAG: hypothetical protein CL844_07565 [Crocinitomicaceae bacterium]|nr:hypothetical protein [Crocinitomicaceae bacterium]|tara:strand:- start:84964 stop:86286 length:1323 start_codon:yes stop_codon:yes gene_type:complete